MSAHSKNDTEMYDDGRVWGFMSGDRFVQLPKTPLLLAGLGPPPFDVTLPSEVRHVIHQPPEET
jgi:hypothetical protein